MNSIDIGAVMREMHAAWNAKDMDKCASYARPDARMTMPSGDSIPFRAYIEMWGKAFPDGQITEVTTVVQGNTVVSEFMGKGTHTGPLDGPMGTIAPTNRRLEMKLVEIGEFNNGKLTSARVYFDTAGMMTQLGLMPQMGAQTQRQAPTPRA